MIFLTRIAAKIMNNYEKLQKITKMLPLLNRIAAKIMKNTENDKKYKNIQLFLHFRPGLQRSKLKCRGPGSWQPPPNHGNPLNLHSLSPPLTAEILKSANARVLLSVCLSAVDFPSRIPPLVGNKKFRVSGTVWASSYGQITALEPDIWRQAR